MKCLLLRLWIAFELARLLAWLTFLGWLVTSHEASWTGGEALLIPSTVALFLGFQYSILSMIATGTHEVFSLGIHRVLDIAISHFLLWLAATSSLLLTGLLLTRKAPSSCAPSPHE